MSEILNHLNSIADSLVAGVILIPLVTAALWLHRMRVCSSKSRVIWLVLAAIAFVSSSFLAIEVHSHKGFDNGLRFAVYCEASFSLLTVAVYPFVRKLLPLGLDRVNWAKNMSLDGNYEWKTYVSPQSLTPKIHLDSKGISFRATFRASGERWANLQIEFTQPKNFSDYTGLTFDIRSDQLYPETVIGLQISTLGNIRYWTKNLALQKKQSVSFSFQETHWSGVGEPSDLGYLDLRRVQYIAVVCRTPCDDVAFTVSKFKLLKTTVKS